MMLLYVLTTMFATLCSFSFFIMSFQGLLLSREYYNLTSELFYGTVLIFAHVALVIPGLP